MEEKKMNTGFFISRNGNFYAVIKYKDKFGNWKQKKSNQIGSIFLFKTY